MSPSIASTMLLPLSGSCKRDKRWAASTRWVLRAARIVADHSSKAAHEALGTKCEATNDHLGLARSAEQSANAALRLESRTAAIS